MPATPVGPPRASLAHVRACRTDSFHGASHACAEFQRATPRGARGAPTSSAESYHRSLVPFVGGTTQSSLENMQLNQVQWHSGWQSTPAARRDRSRRDWSVSTWPSSVEALRAYLRDHPALPSSQPQAGERWREGTLWRRRPSGGERRGAGPNTPQRPSQAHGPVTRQGQRRNTTPARAPADEAMGPADEADTPPLAQPPPPARSGLRSKSRVHHQQVLAHTRTPHPPLLPFRPLDWPACAQNDPQEPCGIEHKLSGTRGSSACPNAPASDPCERRPRPHTCRRLACVTSSNSCTRVTTQLLHRSGTDHLQSNCGTVRAC